MSFAAGFRLNDLKTSDVKTIQYNAENGMILLLPDYNNNAINFNPSIGLQAGCQMVGMSFQNFDTNFLLLNYHFYDEPRLKK